MTPAEKLHMVLVDSGLPELTEAEVKRAHRYMRLVKAGVLDTVLIQRDYNDKNGDLFITGNQKVPERNILELIKGKLAR